MKTKQCTKCKKIKPLSEFYKDKSRKDGYKSYCKECNHIRTRPDKPNCPDGYKYCPKCKEIKPFSEFNKNKNSKDGYKYKCKKCRKKIRKRPAKPKICEICSKEYKPNSNAEKYCSKKCRKIASKIILKKRYQKNKQKIKKYNQTHRKEINEYVNRKLKEDLNFKIANNLRTRVNDALKNNWKSAHTVELVGCSIDLYKQYIENQFTPKMTWQNWGTYWEIDHIIPCASFDMSKKSEQLKCFNYANTRPLTVTENRSKGAKICV